MKANSLNCDLQKLDIKARFILLSFRSKIYVLFEKGYFRRAFERNLNDKITNLSVFTNLQIQSQNFKFKKHIENYVSSMDYILSLMKTRWSSSGGKTGNVQKNEGEKEQLMKNEKKNLFANSDQLFKALFEILKKTLTSRVNGNLIDDVLVELGMESSKRESFFRSTGKYVKKSVDLQIDFKIFLLSFCYH